MLSDYLGEGRRVMQSGLGFSPVKSRLSVLGDDDFSSLRSARGLADDVYGIFLPRTLDAVVNDDRMDSLLPASVHEWLGHGSFYEHNAYGRQMLECELGLGLIEPALVRDKVPAGGRFRLRFSMEPSETSYEDGAYVANVSIDEPGARDYLSYAERLFTLMRRFHGIYEGFAVWTEDYVLSGLGCHGMFQGDKGPYREYYLMLKRFEDEAGVEGMIGKIGF